MRRHHAFISFVFSITFLLPVYGLLMLFGIRWAKQVVAKSEASTTIYHIDYGGIVVLAVIIMSVIAYVVPVARRQPDGRIGRPSANDDGNS